MNTKRWHSDGREAVLYLAESPNRPLIVLNAYADIGQSVVDALSGLSAPEHNLLVVCNLRWHHDMAPWGSPPLFKNDVFCTGGADEYLALLADEIIPRARTLVMGSPVFLGIAGYSLAGLFAIYSIYRTDIFDRVASISGSLWFPGFMEYFMGHEMKRKPDKLYLSIGDKEAETRNKTLMAVRKNTEAFATHCREVGIDASHELNPGNHFQDEVLRSAKGIRAIL